VRKGTNRAHHEEYEEHSAAEPQPNRKTEFTAENAKFAEGFYFKVFFPLNPPCLGDEFSSWATKFAQAAKLFNESDSSTKFRNS
jgi:hypothetical protein